ncbi:agamous-like MADS-box protein AGL61 [Benincasa hispida]|uniref:agamous-like MADS-box protein AGL61 n=1 Tax=Benincasa hispida TaxID=102211 RepID=UPI0018FFAB95|nr:agamous-like MADS-box protein AGL61 [Benincasa hispida]
MKKFLGRRKIEIKKLEKKSTQQVTFSKRRVGLFNKAAELSILCGAEIAILIFTPHSKIYTFAHPNVDALLDRFLTGNFVSPKPLPGSNRDFSEAEAEFEMEKRGAAERLRNSDRFWWDDRLECMRIDELKRFRSSLLQLRANVAKRVENFQAMQMGDTSVTPSIERAGNLPWPPSSSTHPAGNNQCPPSSFHLDGNHSDAMDWEPEIWG